MTVNLDLLLQRVESLRGAALEIRPQNSDEFSKIKNLIKGTEKESIKKSLFDSKTF